MKSRTRHLLLLALLVAAFGWQLWERSGSGAGRGQWLALSAGAPDVLQVGSLKLEPCDIGRRESGVATLRAYCTAFAVPEDWAAPQGQPPAGRQIKLKVAMVRASAAAADPDPVVFLDGGPGGAATDDFPAIAPAFEALRRRHLLLLIDQRGTGGSNALSCEPGQRSRALEGLRDCLKGLAARAAPQFYTTSAAVRDLEAVRQALGAPRLNLIGISYGTRVAQQYARRYPQGVRSIVLDSAVPNDLALGGEHARNLETVLRALALRCRKDQDCAQRYGDPYQLLQRVQARLRVQPQSLELHDPNTFRLQQRQIDADGLAQLLRFYAYSPITAALIPYALKEADEGRYAALLGQTQWVVGEVSDAMESGMALSVICSEDADLLRSRPEDASTVLGNALTDSLLAACPLWPHALRPVGFREPLRGAIPVLLLAGEHDPVTPARYAQAIASHLARARVLTLAGQGHGLVGVGCMPRLLEQFVQSADPWALNAECLQSLGDIPLFLDANGAAP